MACTEWLPRESNYGRLWEAVLAPARFPQRRSARPQGALGPPRAHRDCAPETAKGTTATGSDQQVNHKNRSRLAFFFAPALPLHLPLCCIRARPSSSYPPLVLVLGSWSPVLVLVLRVHLRMRLVCLLCCFFSVLVRVLAFITLPLGPPAAALPLLTVTCLVAGWLTCVRRRPPVLRLPQLAYLLPRLLTRAIIPCTYSVLPYEYPRTPASILARALLRVRLPLGV